MELVVSLAHLPDAVVAPGYDGIFDLARRAEDRGVDGLSLTDHVLLGTRLDSHDALGGSFPWPPDHPYPDPLVLLAGIAAVTRRVTLTTGILIAPLRPAALLAKMVATLDVVARGRVRLGIGSGWQREEFDAVGVPFDERVQRTEDSAAVCRALWRGGGASVDLSTVRFDQMYCSPTPYSPRGPGIWFAGGDNRATARRVAELGDGWLPLDASDVPALARGRELIRAECLRVGRDSSEIGIGVMAGDVVSLEAHELARRVAAWRNAGVTSVSISLAAQRGFSDDAHGSLEAVVAAMRRADEDGS